MRAPRLEGVYSLRQTKRSDIFIGPRLLGGPTPARINMEKRDTERAATTERQRFWAPVRRLRAGALKFVYCLLSRQVRLYSTQCV